MVNCLSASTTSASQYAGFLPYDFAKVPEVTSCWVCMDFWSEVLRLGPKELLVFLVHLCYYRESTCRVAAGPRRTEDMWSGAGLCEAGHQADQKIGDQEKILLVLCH